MESAWDPRGRRMSDATSSLSLPPLSPSLTSLLLCRPCRDMHWVPWPTPWQPAATRGRCSGARWWGCHRRRSRWLVLLLVAICFVSNFSEHAGFDTSTGCWRASCWGWRSRGKGPPSSSRCSVSSAASSTARCSSLPVDCWHLRRLPVLEGWRQLRAADQDTNKRRDDDCEEPRRPEGGDPDRLSGLDD